MVHVVGREIETFREKAPESVGCDEEIKEG